MKRHKALHPLSHDHHLGLIVARRLIKTGEGKFPVMETLDGFLEFWRESLEPHFAAEEAVFPLPEGNNGDMAMTVRMRAEHDALRMPLQFLTGRDEDRLRILLYEIGQALHDHIRFEERELYPALEKSLSEAEMSALGEVLVGVRPKTCMPPERMVFFRKAIKPN